MSLHRSPFVFEENVVREMLPNSTFSRFIEQPLYLETNRSPSYSLRGFLTCIGRNFHDDVASGLHNESTTTKKDYCIAIDEAYVRHRHEGLKRYISSLGGLESVTSGLFHIEGTTHLYEHCTIVHTWDIHWYDMCIAFPMLNPSRLHSS